MLFGKRLRSKGLAHRFGVVICLVAAAGLGLYTEVQASSPPLRIAKNGGARGYILTEFALANYDGGAADCPDGLSLDLKESQIAMLPPGKREEAQKQATTDQIARIILTKPGDTYRGHNICSSPTEYQFTGYKTLDREGAAFGMNLDGTADGHATRSSCAHKKFSGPAGEPGVDNQLWRSIGCIKGFRPGSPVSSGGNQEWHLLLEISDTTNGRADGNVDVGIYTSADVVTYGADGKVVPGLSLQVKDDPRLQNHVQGKIANGVLTTDPFDLRYHVDEQVVHEDEEIRAARIRLEFLPDGRVKGLLAGYYDIDGFYKSNIVAITLGGDIAVGVDCPGLYDALHRLADGYPDPKTGQCTALSGAMVMQGIPAFVIHPDAKPQSADAAPKEKTAARVANWLRRIEL